MKQSESRELKRVVTELVKESIEVSKDAFVNKLGFEVETHEVSDGIAIEVAEGVFVVVSAVVKGDMFDIEDALQEVADKLKVAEEKRLAKERKLAKVPAKEVKIAEVKGE